MQAKDMTAQRLDLEFDGLADIRALADEFYRALGDLKAAQRRQGLSIAPDVASNSQHAVTDMLAGYWQPEMADIRDEIETREGAL